MTRKDFREVWWATFDSLCATCQGLFSIGPTGWRYEDFEADCCAADDPAVGFLLALALTVSRDEDGRRNRALLN